MKSDGGPAFSKTGNYHDGQMAPYDSVDQNGMSLRDYFAAHAPAVPDWYKPFHVPPLPRPAAIDVVASSERLRRAISDWRKDPCFDLEDCGETDAERDELRRFSTAQEEYAEACNKWRKRNDFAREIAWRWEYADKMIVARGADLPTETAVAGG